MRRIGLFFGSFNPIHVGHLIIANTMASQTDLREVWLVVSPQNPFKQKKSLAPERDRLHLVQLAIQDNPNLRVTDIEFGMPKPSYTIDTLTHLREKYPDYQFALIMGSDNLPGFPKWKNAALILRDYQLYVYQRPGYPGGELEEHPNVQLFSKVPIMEISASYIRSCIKKGFSTSYLLTPVVHDYVEKTGMYR